MSNVSKMKVEDVFKKLKLKTDEDREQFVYGDVNREDEINVDGLGLSTYSE